MVFFFIGITSFCSRFRTDGIACNQITHDGGIQFVEFVGPEDEDDDGPYHERPVGIEENDHVDGALRLNGGGGRRGDVARIAHESGHESTDDTAADLVADRSTGEDQDAELPLCVVHNITEEAKDDGVERCEAQTSDEAAERKL